MKRIKLGLCLMAAFAFSVLAVPTAQAKKAGLSGPVHVHSTQTGTEPELGNEVANIKCKNHVADSVISGALTADHVVAKYTGCEAVKAKVPCGNVTPENIDTFSLISDLDWISKAKGEVGVDFKPETGVLLAKFTCKGLAEVSVYGAIIGTTSPHDVMTTEGDVKFTQKEFKNQPENFEKEPNEHLEAEFSTAPGVKVASGQIQGDHTVNQPQVSKKGKKETKTPDPAMVNTTSGEPQYGRCKAKKNGKFSDGNCQSPVAKKGKFEFVPIPG
jgi:hypothetical protein